MVKEDSQGPSSRTVWDPEQYERFRKERALPMVGLLMVMGTDNLTALTLISMGRNQLGLLTVSTPYLDTLSI